MVAHNIMTVQAALDPPLSKTIAQALLDARKIKSLYTHQVAAINALAQRKNVIVSTSTASGKSVIYQVRRFVFCVRVEVLMMTTGASLAISRSRSTVHGDLRLPNQGLYPKTEVGGPTSSHRHVGVGAGPASRLRAIALLVSRSRKCAGINIRW